MPRTLSSAVDNGWAVIGAAAEEGAVPLAQLKIDRPTMLVMGERWGSLPDNNWLVIAVLCCICADDYQ
jgi:hypothetical protein